MQHDGSVNNLWLLVYDGLKPTFSIEAETNYKKKGQPWSLIVLSRLKRFVNPSISNKIQGLQF